MARLHPSLWLIPIMVTCTAFSLSINRHFGCFYSLAVMNSIVIDTEIVIFWYLLHLGMFCSGVIGSYLVPFHVSYTIFHKTVKTHLNQQ